MIQSDIFDSSAMDIKKLANSIIIFIIKRLIEISGILLMITGILLFLALISYSPDDPNFIFPKNIEIKNFLGFHGSYTSDLFFQSIGLIAFLIPITLLFTGINIFKRKELVLIIENLFFTIIYSLLGSLFFAFYYIETFNLYINGNGGFIGDYLNQTFLNSLLSSFKEVGYLSLIFIISIFFLISVNFNLKSFIIFLKKILTFFKKKDQKNYTDKSEIINEYIPEEEIKNLIQ